MYKISLIDYETQQEVEHLEVGSIFQTLNMIKNHSISFEYAKKKYNKDQVFLIIITYKGRELFKILEDDFLVSLHAENLYDIIDATLLDVSPIIKIGYFLHIKDYSGLSFYLRMNKDIKINDLQAITFKDNFKITIDDDYDYLLTNKDSQLEIKVTDSENKLIDTVYKDFKDIVSFASCSEFSDAFLEVLYGYEIL